MEDYITCPKCETLIPEGEVICPLCGKNIIGDNSDE
jgi:RNA polymerase subunit RPABC4/transcription elongation factor Spt4